jgi:mannose-1-phosphate guanylyltransferase
VEVASKSNALVTIGIKPTWACPSYGYIERGGKATVTGCEVENAPYEVSCFREKPDPELAEKFLEAGNFAWNAGMFIWSVPTVLGQLEKHAPELRKFVGELCRSQDLPATVEAQFPTLTPISIDYALMENADRVLNIEANFDWDDVGSWISVAKYLDQQGENNATNTDLALVDSENNIVFNTQKGVKVALLGVDDLIVVQTEDALLVANRHQADSIKKLSAHLREELL